MDGVRGRVGGDFGSVDLDSTEPLIRRLPSGRGPFQLVFPWLSWVSSRAVIHVVNTMTLELVPNFQIASLSYLLSNKNKLGSRQGATLLERPIAGGSEGLLLHGEGSMAVQKTLQPENQQVSDLKICKCLRAGAEKGFTFIGRSQQGRKEPMASSSYKMKPGAQAKASTETGR